MEKKENLRGFNLLFSITQITGGLLCASVLFWCIKYRNGFSWKFDALHLNWHPFLMTLGMVYLYANSIMIYRFLRNWPKKTLKQLHAGIHTTVVVLMITSLYAVITVQNASKHAHLYSLHSWLGVVTVLIFFIQWIAGFVVFLYPGLSIPLRAAFLPVHVQIGLIGFILAVLSCVSGYLEKAFFVLSISYQTLPAEGILINLIGFLFVIFGFLVVHVVTNSNYKRHSKPEDSTSSSHTQLA